MIKKEFVNAKKQEFQIKEFIMNKIGKGKISDLKIERTPIGEKIILKTAYPGLVIGRGGEVIQEISESLKRAFKFENPQIEIAEIKNPEFDAQTVADQLALGLEKFGPLKFKILAYRELDRLSKLGALGAEIKLSGRLPSERAKSWRFSFGYLIKTGGMRQEIVNTAKTYAFTRPGVIGVKVAIIPKGTKIPDRININKEYIDSQLKKIELEIEEDLKKKEIKPKEIKGKTKSKQN